MKKLLKKITFQRIINATVVIAVLIWAGTQIYWLIPTSYDYYEGLPDEVEQLDETIEAQMMDVPETPEIFEAPYSNPNIPIEFNQQQNNTVLSAGEIYKRSLDSIVYINSVSDGQLWGLGSGSVIGTNGIILTNYHVIEWSDKVSITFNDHTTYPVVDTLLLDPEKDIAVLKIDAENLPALPIGNSDNVEVGDDVYVIGHPENFLFTLSEGIISGKREYLETKEGSQFQITNPISAGSSGGALIDSRGSIIGMPVSTFEYAGNIVSVQNINFVIPIRSVLDSL